MAVRVVAVVAVVAVIAMYCYYTATRLDRLHDRVDAAGAALDAQLRRRAAAAVALAGQDGLSAADADALRVAVAAAAAIAGLGHDREVAENALSRLLSRLTGEFDHAFAGSARRVTELHDEALRAVIARRFYNDTVRDALMVRDRRVVRWLGLAGHAPHPAYFEMVDEELARAAETPLTGLRDGHRVEA